MRRYLVPICMLLLAGCAAPMASRPAAAPVTVGIIAFNDFHGALEPPRAAVGAPDGKGGTVLVPAGGAAWLAAAIDTLKAKHPNNVVVSVGDLTGASQLASAIYLDEPAVGVMNRIGLAFNAVGNHEFDRGREELERLQNGGCDKHGLREPCQLEKFAGAHYRYLSASTFTENGSTLFPASGTRTFGKGRRKVSVGFIGLTLKGTPSLVSPGGIGGLDFGDEAEAINVATARLKAQGADAVVVLIHQGGRTSGQPDPNGCEALSGDILPILARLDPRVDVVVSGHTHWAYVCNHGELDPSRPILLTSAGVYGELVTDITLTIDPAADRVIAKTADNVIVQSPGFETSAILAPNTGLYPAFEPRADIAAYVKRYSDAARAFAMRPVGRISGPADRAEEAGGGQGGPLGNLIADAQLAATGNAGARIALTNPFGIRTSLQPAADGTVLFGQIFAAQPFGNTLVTQTLTGAQLKAALEQGVGNERPEQLLAPSAGFSYGFDRSRRAGDRIVRMLLDGKPIDPQGEYRVTTNSFLAQGGDGFTLFAKQRDAVHGGTDLDALEAWLSGPAVRQVPQEQRVTEVLP